MAQVLTNILGNAAKFTKEGKIRIEASQPSEKGLIEIRISDTGGWIPEEMLPRLFEKFATKDVGDSAKHGTGLGLYISKAIVKAHNGNISAFNNTANKIMINHYVLLRVHRLEPILAYLLCICQYQNKH